MKNLLLKFFMKMPTATIIYLMLIIFAKLTFSLQWFVFAIAIDIIDWIISEVT